MTRSVKHSAIFAGLILVLSLVFSSVAFADPVSDSAQNAEIQAAEQRADISSSASKEDAQGDQADLIGSSSTAKDPSETTSSIVTAETPTANAATTPSSNKISLSAAQITKSGMERNLVAGKQIKPQIVVKVNGKTLVEGKDYRVKYGSSLTVPTAAGTYKVVVEAIETSAYSGSVTVGNFKLYSSSIKENTLYTIASSAKSDLLLDAASKAPHQGSNASVWSRHNGSNQQWYFVLGADGYYVIRNAANSSLVLDAAGKTPRQGSNVSVWSSHGGMNQKWIIEQSGSVYIIHSATNFNLVLDAAGSSPHQGSNVSIWGYHGNSNQKWLIKSQEDIYAELDQLAAKNVNAIADGSYTIYASSISGFPVLDVKGGATVNGANVQTGTSNASASQVWEISHVGNYVLVKNKKAGKYLSVASDNSLSGANVVLGSNASTRGAKWIFVKNSDGTFFVRSALYTNISLDIYGGKSASGTNVETYTSNSGKAQKFAIVSTPAQVGTCDKIIDTDGYYFIKSSANSSLQLDVTSASTANNANIELWSKNGLPWQIFRFEYVSGYYRIISTHTNKALTVANNSLVPGANVVNYAVSGNSANQLWQARKNADGSFSFINKQSGFALQVASSTQKAGTNINTSWNSTTNANQKFKLEKLTYLMPTGLFNLKSALNASQVLDVTGGKTADNTNIEIWGNNGAFAQKWNIQTVSGKNNTYILQAVCSGKYLADNGSGNAVQVSSGTAVNSLWTVSIVGGSYLLTNVGTGRVLDVTNAKTSAGTNVGTKAYTGSTNQRWNLVSTVPIPNGTYIIRSKAASSKTIDIAGGATANNANVDLWDYHGGGNQKFNITRNSDGTYTIVNCKSGKALDAAKAQSIAGTNIVQYSKHGQKNQRWRAVYNSDGSFKFVSAANSAVVFAFNGTTPTNGSNVCLVKDTGATAQHFTLEKTTYVPPMSASKRDMLNRAQGYSSGTGYLILVNRGAHNVGVFKGSKGNWSYAQYWSCVTGAPSSPTITGVYRTTGYKKMSLSTDSRARWCTQINGGYFFHTILASNAELGHSQSHGCIRLAVSNAQWIYNNIGRGTTVVIYN